MLGQARLSSTSSQQTARSQNWSEGGFVSRCFDRLYVPQLFVGALAYSAGAAIRRIIRILVPPKDAPSTPVGAMPGQLEIVTTPWMAFFALAFTGSALAVRFHERECGATLRGGIASFGFQPTWLTVMLNIAMWGGLRHRGWVCPRPASKGREGPACITCWKLYPLADRCFIPKNRRIYPFRADGAQPDGISRGTGDPHIAPERAHSSTTVRKRSGITSEQSVATLRQPLINRVGHPILFYRHNLSGDLRINFTRKRETPSHD